MRTEHFQALKQHPWMHKIYAKLTEAEENFCQDFLRQNREASKGDFETLVNRLFMDQPELRKKYRHWKEISELLTCANSAT